MAGSPYTPEEIAEAGLDDFREFLQQAWDFLDLPLVSKIQNDIAWWVQHGPRRFIICGFRGVAKTWVLCAFIVWTLLIDPSKKILVVSANENLAKDVTRFCRTLIDGMEILQHLKPPAGMLDTTQAFMVGCAPRSKDPSLKSAGITGQITGNRADLIIFDDVEVPKNSRTHVLRELIAELVKEADAVLKPGGRVIYLGTPQNEQSLYVKLLDRGYVMRVWPVQIPEKPELYIKHDKKTGELVRDLAPFVHRRINAGWKPGTPLDEGRFPRAEIDERMASYGLAAFELQFMLNTHPSDEEKHPLKTRDLLIVDADQTLGHVKVVWSQDHIIQELHSAGLEGDFYVRPAYKTPEMIPWGKTFCWIDPSGKGTDETSYAIVRELKGQLYLVDCGGFTDGFGQPTLRAIAAAMIAHRVNMWCAESNYGGGMFAELLKPVLQEMLAKAQLAEDKGKGLHLCSYDEDFNTWSSTQKEMRIIDTLGPLMKAHRLCVDRRVIEKDESVDEKYSLIYQMTRLSRDKNSLANEDRIEAVAAACSYFTAQMRINQAKAESTEKNKRFEEELEKFIKGARSSVFGGVRKTTTVNRFDNHRRR